jgi:hypothetical protein
MENINSIRKVIENFNLDFQQLNEKLLKYNGIIAGGCALMAYINEINDYNGDIDIWFPCLKGEEIIIINDMSNFLLTYGYKPKERYYTSEKYKYNENEHYLEISNKIFDNNTNPRFIDVIHTIRDFTFYNCKIQLLFTYINHMDILNSFDFSFCATSWDGNKFYNINPGDTLLKIGTQINPRYFDKDMKRINKYKKRGFIITNESQYIYNKFFL